MAQVLDAVHKVSRLLVFRFWRRRFGNGFFFTNYIGIAVILVKCPIQPENFSFLDPERLIEFHRKYALVPADKAANNVVVV